MFCKVVCLKLLQIWIWVYQYENNLSLRWSSWWQTLESLPWPAFSPVPRSGGAQSWWEMSELKTSAFPPVCGLWGSFCSISQLLLSTLLILLLVQDSSPALMAGMQRTSWCVMVFRNHCPYMLLLCSSSINKGLQWKMWAWVGGKCWGVWGLCSKWITFKVNFQLILPVVIKRAPVT